MIYKHTQRAAWFVVLTLLAIVVLWAAMVWSVLSNPQVGSLAFRIAGGVTVVLLLALMFSSLTIAVREDEVVWWFGLGWPRGRMLLADVLDAAATRTTPLQGWGIHLTTSGWLWNVSGLNAVRLRNANKHIVLLGTDRPQELLDAIARARWAGA